MFEGLAPVWVGVAEIGLGLVFCFIGHTAARAVLALWGALVGMVGGTLLYVILANWLQEPFTTWVPWWAVAIVTALLLAWLSFAFYAFGVLVSMGAIGWGLGQFASTTMHLPDWIAFGMGLIAAAGLVMVGWTLNLPKVLLVVVTSLVGAGAIIDGIQAVLGQRIDWFNQMGWRTDLVANSAWTVAFVILAAAGIIIQSRQSSEATLREAYRRV
jgi:hypothetical protein